MGSGRIPGNLDTVIELGNLGVNDSDVKPNGSAPDGAAVGDMKTEEECSHALIDVVEVENKAVCRICHLSGKEIDQSVDELMELGCGCRGELGLSHVQCAEAWFKVKGNLSCEICGETARNVTGTSQDGFMEVWNHGPSNSGGTGVESGSNSIQRCLQGQHVCNCLMAFLVAAFVFPWFFHPSMI